MSSTTGDPDRAGRGPQAARRSWSITGRLTALYTLSAFGILLLPTVLMYWVLERNLEEEDAMFLTDKLRVMRDIVQAEPRASEALAEEIERETAPGLSGRYYARVLASNGVVLVETPGMHAAFPSASFPAVEAHRAAPDHVFTRRRSESGPYLLMAAWSDVGRPSADHWLFQLALDVSRESALIAEYRRMMAAVLALGIAVSALAGVGLARRGLRPLAEITRAAERVTPDRLHERIGRAPWPAELVALARVFDAMLDRLEDSFQRLNAFSADLAHELRTPIANLMGEAEVALARARTSDEYREVLESSLEEYGRLSRMTENLLFLARADRDRRPVDPRVLDARREIEAIREFHDAQAEEGGVAVTCLGGATAWADPVLFQRAVSNVLSNALRHTPPGGSVTMMAMGAPDGSVRVQVRDTGCGIPPEHLGRVFDRFYRVDTSRSGHRDGTGLGLAIVKSIMELHRGTATVESEVDSGTVVTLTFPPRA